MDEVVSLQHPTGLMAGNSVSLAGDDRDPGRAWTASTFELILYVLGSLLNPANGWTHRPELSVSSVVPYLHARALLGLPHWLRTAPRRVSRCPSLFPLVKSKCFDVGGKCICPAVQKGEYHNCISTHLRHLSIGASKSSPELFVL